ncbi:MAG TPA: erythromycin esterase family protein [Marmoricola sp.]|nr:erythromycin esterase family protein [Marmoricola sp.]
MSDFDELMTSAAINQVRHLARSLNDIADLDPLVDLLAERRFACIGEASHGTHEYYRWRAELSKRLIQEHGFTWIGVEGDWPDCWRINRWLRGHENQGQTADQILARFERWPTWMWANHEMVDFLDWLHQWNATRPMDERVGFYGLDVYSLWDSLREIIAWLRANEPEALESALNAWQCFLPYDEDPHRYAWATRLVPLSCEDQVVDLLTEVRRRTRTIDVVDDEDAFDAAQNAQVVLGAELYYRTMVRGNTSSWNIRDHHMASTIERISSHLGPQSKGLIWEHNTHIGDARATDMESAGMVNVGQLIRERYGAAEVALVGFAGYRGSVLAASGWGEPETAFPVPPARARSHELLIHLALRRPAVIVFGEDRGGAWLAATRGHRAIGVVYNPDRETGNYVPTVMGARYDALIWLEETTALQPLHRELTPREPEFETEPSGF